MLQVHAARLVEAIGDAGIQLDPAGMFALDRVRDLTGSEPPQAVADKINRVSECGEVR
jgi:hypothetical protein